MKVIIDRKARLIDLEEDYPNFTGMLVSAVLLGTYVDGKFHNSQGFSYSNGGIKTYQLDDTVITSIKWDIDKFSHENFIKYIKASDKHEVVII
jgi:hypothetical protein